MTKKHHYSGRTPYVKHKMQLILHKQFIKVTTSLDSGFEIANLILQPIALRCQTLDICESKLNYTYSLCISIITVSEISSTANIFGQNKKKAKPNKHRGDTNLLVENLTTGYDKCRKYIMITFSEVRNETRKHRLTYNIGLFKVNSDQK